MNKSARNIIILVLSAALIFGIVFAVIALTQNAGKTQGEISKESALAALDKLYKNVNVNIVEPVKANVDLDEDDKKDTLPDISKYPPQVENTTDSYIEMFSSPEKAGSGTDGWLVEVAENFNKAGVIVNGNPVSVRIRGISSGEGLDYIVSQKYVPDAYSPSNELWGEMLKEKGIEIVLAEERLAGNVAGVLFSNNKHEELIQKYGSVSLKTVTEAVINNEIAMGYTNPFASSSGLNFLVSSLYIFDMNNPLSDAAVSTFEQFQSNIPFVSYTTLQMRESAKSGALDGFILEYQSYVNSPDIMSDYIFTPFGIRHDNPVYEIGKLSDEKKEILQKFIDFCKNSENQALASDKYGFNKLDDYINESGNAEGSIIVQAQKLWKEKKNAVNEIAAVFVADVSGSMMGEPLNKLKESLVRGSKYIGQDNSIGLVSFSDEVNINLPIGKFDINQRSLFTGSVQNLQAEGNTAMFDGIVVAMRMLMDEKEKNPNAKLMLFVLTDGQTNRGLMLNNVNKAIGDLRIPIYTIGYNVDESMISSLQTISNINEAASINAETDDVVYKLINFFNAQM